MSEECFTFCDGDSPQNYFTSSKKVLRMKKTIIGHVAKLIYFEMSCHDLERYSIGYQELMENLDLSRGAIANGLKQLKAAGLIKTTKRSTFKKTNTSYQLTDQNNDADTKVYLMNSDESIKCTSKVYLIDSNNNNNKKENKNKNENNLISQKRSLTPRHLFDLWNELAPKGVKKVRVLTPQREKVANDILKIIPEPDIWATAFKNMAEHKRCHAWIFFDWVFREKGTNLMKLYEGNYSDREKESQDEMFDEIFGKKNTIQAEGGKNESIGGSDIQGLLDSTTGPLW